MNKSENVNFHKPGSKNGYRIVKREQEQKLIEKHRKEIESLKLQWEKRFKELENNMATYEQELYEKDRQLQELQNEQADFKAQTIEEAKAAVQKEIDEKDPIDTYSRDGNDEDYLSNNSKAGR
jgi:chromosome segregation ATPase